MPALSQLQTGYDVQLGRMVTHVNGTELNTATHDFDQPEGAVYIEALWVQVQHAVPFERIIIKVSTIFNGYVLIKYAHSSC